jgi:hypothetical protein
MSFRANFEHGFAQAAGIETTDFARVSPNLDGATVKNIFGVL